MNNGKIIGGLLITAGTVSLIYFGFIKKFKDGLTGIEKLIGKKTAANQPEGKTPGNDSPKIDKSIYNQNTGVVPPVISEPVPETPQAKTLSQLLDDKKGIWIKAKFDNTPVYYVNNSVLYKKFNKGQDIGRVGENLNNGYHKVFDMPATNGAASFKISDQYLKYIFNL